MKRAYKDEQDIIEHASEIDDLDVCFYPAESNLARRFLASVRNGTLVQRERPDFEDPAEALLLEAMVVDDHPRPGGQDKTRSREAEALRELAIAGLNLPPDFKVITTVSSGLPMHQDHNYRAYIDHFTGTVLKHARKSAAYRATQPGYELGFIVFDESTAYFEEADVAGLPGAVRPHFWFADSAFIHVVVRADADCVVWLTPYKRLIAAESVAVPLPAMTIIDVSLLR
ncbi:hypothetical protein [Plantibacter sp. Leaf314]|uniref:hypothetical protein n=1 Tax=Plantibacter sp. Leaf314 TaxID=1736333 RepID=UPI0006FF45F8|nr:hypothetical protein [Plantibacter sp. Leaf314]KQQ52900.1 hypothetical protein ASF68_11635 [Plantibacter sp. Leaf314]